VIHVARPRRTGHGVAGAPDGGHARSVPQPYDGDGVAEIVVGVPGRTWDGSPF
jgi:hypothetical protein